MTGVDRFLRLRDAASPLGLRDGRDVYRLVRMRLLRATKIDGKLVIAREEVERRVKEEEQYMRFCKSRTGRKLDRMLARADLDFARVFSRSLYQAKGPQV